MRHQVIDGRRTAERGWRIHEERSLGVEEEDYLCRRGKIWSHRSVIGHDT